MRFAYVRVQVEIETTKPILENVHVVDVESRLFQQIVVVEWAPYYYRKRERVGHDYVKRRVTMV